MDCTVLQKALIRFEPFVVYVGVPTLLAIKPTNKNTHFITLQCEVH